MKVAALIPARYHSSRLPGKPLADIAGEPMIRWVYERARSASLVNELWVATDDERIYSAVKDFGGNCWITSPKHLSGTDRIAEIAKKRDWDLVVNVQGDEPLIDPAMVDAVIIALQEDSLSDVSTLKKKITAVDEIFDPNVVKVVTDKKGCALYFSRAPIPYFRDTWEKIKSIGNVPSTFSVFKHVGLYAYKREALLHITGVKPTPLEKIERLEQLRFLENGFKIKVKTTQKDSVSVDSPDDLSRVRRLIKSKGISCTYK